MVKFMKKYIKCIFLLILMMLILTGCETGTGSGSGGVTIDPLYHECLDNQSEWKIIKEATCNELGLKQTFCTICGDVVDEEKISELRHYYIEDVAKEATCTEEGILRHTCNLCGDVREKPIKLKDHEKGRVTVIKEQTSTTLGVKEVKCKHCNEVLQTLTFVNNGYLKNGKLSVKGADLVNQYGEKFQLFGVSTHGLQWFGRYANFDTIASIQENFGNNIVRFAFYTDENGYCDGTESKQKQMLEDLIRGVDAATALGLYVIIDWHMVGAENYADKNPLTYLEQSKQFFSYISNYYKDQNNILYEIMNEPNGKTTWEDCKKYANEVIPCIRKNTDAIVLVGNPRWTADLYSVMKDPLVGYENIMYTYHFYAADHSNTTQVETAYDKGFPVFISEFGFMYSDGDGNYSEKNGNRWKQVLDSRNISYVAWNISNSVGSASIFKYQSYDMIDVSDANLKPWGIYLKNWYRNKSGLDVLTK